MKNFKIKSYKLSCPNCGQLRIFKSYQSKWSASKKETICKICATAKKFNRTPISESIIKGILSGHHSGLTDIEISKQFLLCSKTVSRIISQHGRERVRTPHLLLVNDKEAYCGKCDSIKNLDLFRLVKKPKRKQYRKTFCITCENKQVSNRNSSTLEKYLQTKVRRLRSCSKEQQLPVCNIDTNYLLEIFNNQLGNCFYTDSPMIFQLGKGQFWNTISVDKVIPEFGYTKNNIVLSTKRANMIKSNMTLKEMREWTPGWYNRLITKFPELEIK